MLIQILCLLMKDTNKSKLLKKLDSFSSLLSELDKTYVVLFD